MPDMTSESQERGDSEEPIKREHPPVKAGESVVITPTNDDNENTDGETNSETNERESDR